MSPRAWLGAQALVTAVLLALLVRSLDLDALAALFRGLPAWFYAVSLLVVLAGQIAYAWRWRVLLGAAGVHVPFGLVLRQYFIGIFVNNFLPSTVGGDAAKVYLLGRQCGYRPVTASVAVDRLLGVGLLAMLASAALWIGTVDSPRLSAALVASAGVSVLALGLLAIVAVGTGGLPSRVARFGNRAVRLAGRLQRLRLDMAAPLLQPAAIAQAALVVIVYALAVTVVYTRFTDLQGGAVPPFVTMLGVVTATTVLSNIPISLNGLGLREQLHASLLVPLGVPVEAAVAISLLLYAHLLVASLIGLLFWLQTPVAVRDVSEAP